MVDAVVRAAAGQDRRCRSRTRSRRRRRRSRSRSSSSSSSSSSTRRSQHRMVAVVAAGAVANTAAVCSSILPANENAEQRKSSQSYRYVFSPVVSTTGFNPGSCTCRVPPDGLCRQLCCGGTETPAALATKERTKPVGCRMHDHLGKRSYLCSSLRRRPNCLIEV